MGSILYSWINKIIKSCLLLIDIEDWKLASEAISFLSIWVKVSGKDPLHYQCFPKITNVENKFVNYIVQKGVLESAIEAIKLDRNI